MKSDVKLEDDNIFLEANYVHASAHDFKLDSTSRRKPGGSAHRRAMVHGFSDELVINFKGDYQGGTYIHSKLDIHGNLEIRGSGLQIKDAAGNVIVSLGQGGNLILGGNRQDGDIILQDEEGKRVLHIDARHLKAEWPLFPGERARSGALPLLEEIRRMKEEIIALKEEISALRS